MSQKRHRGAGVAAALGAVAAAGIVAVAGAQESVVKHMHEHYDAVVKVQSAVIAGDLDAMREPAAWLAEHQPPGGLPAEWGAHVEAMRAAARAALEAEDFETAGIATSQLGVACGGCHVANDVTVEFEDVDRPKDKSDSVTHMGRHQWAADRMWEGLVGPSTPAWRRGAGLLFESPLTPEKLDADPGDGGVQQMARRIHQLAANGSVATTPDEKAEIYAEFLANCAACHTALQQGPGPAAR